MQIKSFIARVFFFSAMLAACARAGPPEEAATSGPAGAESNAASTTAPPGAAPHGDTVDVTHLILGDGRVSTSPQRGYVDGCMTQFSGRGAQGTGWWMNDDGSWDLTRKAIVDGAVSWPHTFEVSVQGDLRAFTGNGLPGHTTGLFPIAASDDAYQVDRNPNAISSRDFTFSLPAKPTLAAQPNCIGGEVGVLLSGGLLFSAFDADGHDAAAHEVQDACGGHPQREGVYHYHSLSDCLEDATAGHSALMGYAFDGFGLFGYYGVDGRELTNEDLDECHGHTHSIEWDGRAADMYHYHATHEFPYTIGCFRGNVVVQRPGG